MQRMFKFFGCSVFVTAFVLMNGGAFGADRGGATRSGARAGVAGTSRMPTMPSMPINAIGNMTANLPTPPSAVAPTTPDTPPEPVKPDNPDTPPTPDKPDNPGVTPPECPDGGVKNSTYTVDSCMNDVLRCVNGGGLPNGINDLFSSETFNSVLNGMRLCATQVDKCVNTVRKNCEYVYHSQTDVLMDFNARKVQPEYYNFVLRKTGLTPNQAENTCWMLDKNTSGSSFTSGQVAAVTVGGTRGNFARWDAVNADCLIRVAAYNKDNQIKNSWLFGAAGDDRVAEVWQTMGSSFSCNKDLFGFSLKQKTKTAAVVGIGGGTLVGAGVGAMAGHGARAFDCSIKKHRDDLLMQMRAEKLIDSIYEYDSSIGVTPTATELSESQCLALKDLYDRAGVCDTFEVPVACSASLDDGKEMFNINAKNLTEFQSQVKAQLGKYDNKIRNTALLECLRMSQAELVAQCEKASDVMNCVLTNIGLDGGDLMDCEFAKEVNRITVFGVREKSNRLKTTLIGAGVGAGVGGLATTITSFVEKGNINCRVGDNLEKVGYGKSYNIGTLRDYYVKWNLRLPDSIMPTSTVTDCASWQRACRDITDLGQCRVAQINYQPATAPAITLVHSACIPSGNQCIENYAVAKSYGACLGDASNQNPPPAPEQPNVPTTLPDSVNVESGQAPAPTTPDVTSGVAPDNDQQKLWYQTWNSPM